jgi:hypothetical protein
MIIHFAINPDFDRPLSDRFAQLLPFTTTVCRYRIPDFLCLVMLYPQWLFENRVLRAGDKNELGIISEPNSLS